MYERRQYCATQKRILTFCILLLTSKQHHQQFYIKRKTLVYYNIQVQPYIQRKMQSRIRRRFSHLAAATLFVTIFTSSVQAQTIVNPYENHVDKFCKCLFEEWQFNATAKVGAAYFDKKRVCAGGITYPSKCQAKCLGGFKS